MAGFDKIKQFQNIENWLELLNKAGNYMAGFEKIKQFQNIKNWLELLNETEI